MNQGGENALQAICGEFDSHWVHMKAKQYDNICEKISDLFQTIRNTRNWDESERAEIMYKLRTIEDEVIDKEVMHLACDKHRQSK